MSVQPRRRGRPRGDTLDRDDVIAAARALASTGIEAVTMTALAERLKVTPMAIYRHVRDKEHLMALLLDDLLSEIIVPDTNAGTWQQRLRGYHQSIVAALTRYPGVFGHLYQMPPLRNSSRLLEGYLQILLDAGLDDRDAIAAYTTLYYLAVGTVIDEATRPARSTPAARSAPEWSSPAFERMAASAAALRRTELHEAALEIALSGIASLTPSTHSRQRNYRKSRS